MKLFLIKIFISFLLLSSFAMAQGAPFDFCGVITEKTDAGCYKILTDLSYTLYTDDIGGYRVGDTVRIVGTIFKTDSNECYENLYSSLTLVIDKISDCLCCRGYRGNIDNSLDEIIDIDDIVLFVDYAFNLYFDRWPICLDELDINGDGQVDIDDVVYLVRYAFSNPPGPYPVECPDYDLKQYYHFAYTGFDSAGVVVVLGEMELNIENEKINGTWILEAQQDSALIGPQTGSGNLTGFVHPGNVIKNVIFIDLNPGWADNNVTLHGYIVYDKFFGTWAYSGFIGSISRGTFVGRAID